MRVVGSSDEMLSTYFLERDKNKRLYKKVFRVSDYIARTNDLKEMVLVYLKTRPQEIHELGLDVNTVKYNQFHIKPFSTLTLIVLFTYKSVFQINIVPLANIITNE